jgi:hypothetical protein
LQGLENQPAADPEAAVRVAVEAMRRLIRLDQAGKR